MYTSLELDSYPAGNFKFLTELSSKLKKKYKNLAEFNDYMHSSVVYGRKIREEKVMDRRKKIVPPPPIHFQSLISQIDLKYSTVNPHICI